MLIFGRVGLVRRVGAAFGQLGLKLLHCRQSSLEILGQFYQVPKLGDAHRRRGVPEGIFRYDPVLRFAQDEADARLVVGMAEKVVDGGEVEVHLAGVLRLERRRLQVNNHEASELQVVEEQVQPEVLSTHLKRHLAPDKGEPYAEFDEKLTQVFEKAPFEVALLRFRSEGEEIEVVGIFDELLCQIGLRRRESRLEVRQCFSLPPVEAAFDLDHEDVPAPAVLDGLLRVPETLLGGLYHIEDANVVPPGNLSNSLLDECFVRPGLRESPHVEQVGSGEALDIRKFVMEIVRKPLDNLGAPPGLLLALQNIAAEPPIEQNQLAVDR